MDKTIEQQLKPCPFCGGEAKLLVGYHALYDVKIKCQSCDTEGPLFGADDFKGLDGGESYKAEAITAWNTRPAPSEEEVEGAKWIRAWRNRFISERMNAYRNDPYEVCRAKAEADANDFEEAFRERMARAALGVE